MLGCLSLLLLPTAARAKGPLVLAAASLQESLEFAADRWAARGHERPRLAFAASAALTRQIEAGAPADLFISADEAAMNAVAARRRILPATRKTLVRNTLILVAPAGSPVKLRLARGVNLVHALGPLGRLAMGDPDSVPAGRYGKAALVSLRAWQGLSGRLAFGENVRATLALVERGEAALGIVYATDARISKAVRMVAPFPTGSHPPIIYPIARLRSSRNGDAEGFRRFLLSREGKAIFARYGFRP